jgi:hypothetical protein
MTAVMKEPMVLKELFSIPIEDGESFEIFNETSILRDHWSTLGKTIISRREETNKARTMYLQNLCKILNINFQKLEKLPCYYSLNSHGEKQFVNSPSNYPSENTLDDNVKDLRALFNMRQDLLIIYRDTLFFIEAKLESANSSDQIHNMLLLEKLLDPEKECWAGLNLFLGIKKVKFFYIKKTDTPLRVDGINDLHQMEIITWSNVFKVIKPIIRELRGVNIDKLKII